MKILSDGKSNVLTGTFPKKFKLQNAGVDVPFLRTGNNSIRLLGEVPVGELDIQEVARKKTVQPAKLDIQSIAVINKSDFDRIDQLNKKLAINQEVMNNQMAQLTAEELKLASLETENATQIQNTNASLTELAKEVGTEIQKDRITLNQRTQALSESITLQAESLNKEIQSHKSSKNPHKITKDTIGLNRVDNTSDVDKPISKATQDALSTKADKTEVEKVNKELTKLGKKQKDLINGLNTWGGVGTGGSGGSGIDNPDDLTINNNEVGQIQAIGTIDKGTNKPLYDWTGTLEEYKLLDQNNQIKNDWVYYITNDWSGGVYNDSLKWGDIDGTLSDQTDLQQALNSKQGTLTAGAGILIQNGVISCTVANPAWGTITGTLSEQTDLQNALDGKQPTISNLSTIESNAQAGKNASDTIDTYGDIVTHNASEFQPAGSYATSEQGAKADTALQPNDVVNNVTTSTTNVPLSANMGKELQQQINNLKSIGRFLALWNCATGLAESDPTTSPRPYNTGDYFVVGVVATGSANNYKPSGSEYITGQASTVIETNTVAVNDVYFYDGTNWTLQNNHGGLETVSFSNITGQPSDNTNLNTALNSKVTKNDDITGATKCKITYDSKGLVTAGADLSSSDIPNLSLSKITDVTASATELNYCDGVTSNIQTQLNGKQAKVTYDSANERLVL